MLSPNLCILSQVFVFKKTDASAGDHLTVVMNGSEKPWFFSIRC